MNWKVNFGWMNLKDEMKEELLMEILLLKLLIFGVTFQINGSQHCVKTRMKKLVCISPLKPNNNKIVQLLLKKLIYYYYYWIFLLVKIAFFLKFLPVFRFIMFVSNYVSKCLYFGLSLSEPTLYDFCQKGDLKILKWQFFWIVHSFPILMIWKDTWYQ